METIYLIMSNYKSADYDSVKCIYALRNKEAAEKEVERMNTEAALECFGQDYSIRYTIEEKHLYWD